MNLPFTTLPGRLAIILLCAPLAGSAQGRPESRPEIARLWLTLSNAPASARVNSDVSDHASVFHSDGSIRHLVAPRGQHFTAAPGPVNDSEPTARRFLHDHALAFGIRSERVGFEPHRQHTGNGRHYLRLQQTFSGLPVYAGQIVLQVDEAGGVEYAANYLERGLHAFDGLADAITPSILAAAAQERARALLQTQPAAPALNFSTPTLLWYSPAAVGMRGTPRLAWMLVAGGDSPSAIHERIFIDAQTGDVLDRLPLSCDILHRTVFNANNDVNWPPGFPSPPPLPSRIEGGPAPNDGEVNAVFDVMGDVYNFYRDKHGRNGIGGSDQPIFAIVRVCVANQACPWPNASWSGLPDDVPKSIFGFNINEGILSIGQGFAKDDVLAHEFTHGVTEFESGLKYRNASGAINEAFSDIWGEFVDWGNGRGNDSPGVRWDIGEDLTGGRLRSMSFPTNKSDPDRLGSALVSAPTANPTGGPGGNDQGGVHNNSGIVNKLCYLLTDGDTFNGYAVSGLGMDRIVRLFYEVNSNLLGPNADYTDLSIALHQAAANLGWSQSDRANLHRACLAVEIVGNYVDRANGNNSPNGCRQAGIGAGGPFPKVGQAVNALQTGDTLFVRGGNYNEAVRITKPMRLVNYSGTAVIGRP